MAETILFQLNSFISIKKSCALGNNISHKTSL